MATTCAVGPCQQPRVEGSSYCPHHGPGASGKPKAATMKGTLRPQLVCPHCQEKGTVRTRVVRTKKGVSAGKAGAAVLSGGLSLFSIGIKGKGPKVTEAHCDSCSTDWTI